MLCKLCQKQNDSLSRIVFDKTKKLKSFKNMFIYTGLEEEEKKKPRLRFFFSSSFFVFFSRRVEKQASIYSSYKTQQAKPNTASQTENCGSLCTEAASFFFFYGVLVLNMDSCLFFYFYFKSHLADWKAALH